MSYRIGIDIGGTNVKTGVVDTSGKILAKESMKTRAERPYAEVIADIARHCLHVTEKAGLKMTDIEKAGVGMPGTINSETGDVFYSNNIAWKNVPLGRELERLLGVPVKVDNDANVAALGEHMYGAGKEYDSSVLFTLGTGIGGGIILNGRIFSGFKSAGAELGHTVIVKNGEPCTCGRRGCFEAYASATGLIKLTRAAMRANPDSLMWELAGTAENAGGRTAYDAATRGDAAGIAVTEQYVEYLSEGIVNVVNILRPEAVILGGGVSAQGDTLLLPLKRLCFEKAYGGTEYAPFDIIIAKLGNDAGLLGASAL